MPTQTGHPFVRLPGNVVAEVSGNDTGVKAVGLQAAIAQLRGQRQREQHVGRLGLPVRNPLVVRLAILKRSVSSGQGGEGGGLTWKL